MITDDDESPAVVTLDDGATTPSVIRLPEGGKIPWPTMPKRPPRGRPAGAVTLHEMIDQITREVRRTTTTDVDRSQGELRAELRAELAAEVKTAKNLGLAAVVMTVVFAIVAGLAGTHIIPATGLGLALVAFAAVYFVATYSAPGRVRRGPFPR